MTFLVDPPLLPASAFRMSVELSPAESDFRDLPIDNWGRLERFLTLGREDGSYRAFEPGLSLASAHCIFSCLVADGPRVVRSIVNVSESGRSARPETLLFALALAASDRASHESRSAALEAIPLVCRTGAQLLQLARYVDHLRGWGRGLRRAIAEWYRQPLEQIVYQVAATPALEGWSHRDLLRLAHPKAPGAGHQEFFRWIVRGWGEFPADEVAELRLIHGIERARRAENRENVLSLIREYGLPANAVPGKWRRDRAVASALADSLSIPELFRSFESRVRNGDTSNAFELSARVATRFGDEESIRKSKVQPVQVLSAWAAYQELVEKADGTQRPEPVSAEIVETAFHAAIDNLVPTGKRWLTALDDSGSMESHAEVGIPGVSPRLAAAAMAMTAANVELRHTLVGFTAGAEGPGGRWGDGQPSLTRLDLTSSARLGDLMRYTQRLPMGGTDCALPIRWALQRKIPVDVFAIYTDSETWWGRASPAQALREYRERMGIPAKLVVVGLASEGFSIADAGDAGMLDVVGFDIATPKVIADFARS